MWGYRVSFNYLNNQIYPRVKSFIKINCENFYFFQNMHQNISKYSIIIKMQFIVKNENIAVIRFELSIY